MCPHLILTRQNRESCEFLRSGTEAVETINVLKRLLTYKDKWNYWSDLPPCWVRLLFIWGGGSPRPQRLSQVSRACILTKPFKVQSLNFISQDSPLLISVNCTQFIYETSSHWISITEMVSFATNYRDSRLS